MCTERVTELQAHAEHLLDRYISLRAQFAVLQPMLTDADTRNLWGAGDRARGFSIVRITLFRSCALEIANLIGDRDGRTPSIRNLVAGLKEEGVAPILAEQFASVDPIPEDPRLADIRDALVAEEEARAEKRRQEFAELVAALKGCYARLEASGVLKAFVTLRNKNIAHAEVVEGEQGYDLFDVGTLNLKWSDLAPLVQVLEELVQLVSRVFRGAAFDFEMLEGQLTEASAAFWRQHDR